MTKSSETILDGDSRPNAEDCGKLLLLQADFDGELDAAQAVALAEHRASCPVCKRNETILAAACQAARGATYHRASPELLRAVASRIAVPRAEAGPASEAPPRRTRAWISWQGIAGFGAGAALAAAVVLTFLPAGRPELIAALVDDHVRALQPGHLLDVVSTNQHTVKPWFDGKLDFAPPVKNLAAAGFPLLGGRLDYVHGRAVAVLVYGRGKHLLELYVWPASTGMAEPARAARDGYNVVHWQAEGMSLSAVSDLDPAGLAEFVREWQQAPP
jgi:anti-sigma factor RsiW